MERKPFCLNFGATKFQEKYKLKKSFKPLFKKSNDDFEMRFYTAKHIESGEICAIKEVICEKEKYIDYAWKEVETVIKLRDHKCQNLIKYYEAFLYDFVDTESGIEMQGVKIVMELGDYPLSDMVQVGLEEEDAYEKIKETLTALQQLKSFGVQPRYIKPSNLVVKDNVLKVIDFPCLTKLAYDDEEKLKFNVENSDLFSLGLTFLQLCRRMGAEEYSQFQQKATFYYCNNQKDKYQQLFDNQFSKIKNLELKGFLQNVLRFRPEDRWDLDKCLLQVEENELKQGYERQIVIQSEEDYENFVKEFEQMEEGMRLFKRVSVQFGGQESYQAFVFQKIQKGFLQKVEKLKFVYSQQPNLEALNQLLGKLKKLKMLEFQISNHLQDDSYEKLIQSIKNSSKLSHLQLNLSDSQIGDKGTSKLADGLKSLQNLSHLQLDLSSNTIFDNGISKLADGLKSLQNLSHLKLQLLHTHIGENGAMKLVDYLKFLQNLSHLELNLQSNHIRENGGQKLADSLKSLQNLSRLELNLQNNYIGENGASKLVDGLKSLQNLSHLHLNLQQNQIGDNVGSKLTDSLKSLQNLSHLHLNLQWNQIGEKGGSEFADGLKSLQNLSHLELNLLGNQIRENGVYKLADGLNTLQNLSHLQLDLSCNYIGENGGSKLGDSLKSLQNLSHLKLDLQLNQIGENGVSKLADGLKSLQNLSHLQLDLSCNQIGENGGSKLIDDLKSLQNLSHLQLDLSGNQIGENGEQKLADSLKSLQNFSHLELNLSGTKQERIEARN